MATQVATKYNVGGVLLDRPFKVRRLGHFGFNATNIDACTHFYSDLLGFKISDEGPVGGGHFMRFGTDHHAFAMFNRQAMEARAAASGAPPGRPDNTINQITWQTQSLSEPVNAVDYLKERGIPIQRTGRDGAGSNWATYFPDPDGHINELYYGIEQIGWDGHSKPAEYRRPIREKVVLPVKSELEEVEESLATTGVPFTAGYRHVETMPAIYDVSGVMLPRPFKIVRHGPVCIFVEDVDRATAFYTDVVGLEVTEDSVWQGDRCRFLRCNTEHHSIGLFPKSWRDRLGLSAHTSCMSFGVQVANYQQLRDGVRFLREHGVRVETNLIPPVLYPGIDYCAHAFDPDGHCIQIYYYMEQVGWDGTPHPRSARRQIDPTNWPEVLEPLSDTYKGEPFLGPWG
ncbi:MAG TPA: VOC family protein [Chloroflexota bacterium]|nr:VOC family protein [Chloroflexota bacterium]